MDQTAANQTSVIIVDQMPVTFDLEAVGRKLGIKGQQGRSWDLLADMAEAAAAVARPRAAAKLCGLTMLGDDQVRVGDVTFTSPLLRQNLGELGRAFPYLATEGEELSEWGRSYSSIERLFANALQHAAVKQAEALLEKTVREKFGIAQVSAMNPGSLVVWPITQQAPLFQLLAPLPGQLGVTLLPSFMMKPEQTVSGLYFQTDKKFFNCQLCPRENCPNRKAPSTVI